MLTIWISVTQISTLAISHKLHTYACTLTPTHSQTDSQKHTHKHIQTHTHTHGHTDKQADTKRHRHTHARTLFKSTPLHLLKHPTSKHQNIKASKKACGQLDMQMCNIALCVWVGRKTEWGPRMFTANAQTRARASRGVTQNLTVLRLSVPGQQLRIEIRRIILVEHLRLRHTTFIVSPLKRQWPMARYLSVSMYVVNEQGRWLLLGQSNLQFPLLFQIHLAFTHVGGGPFFFSSPTYFCLQLSQSVSARRADSSFLVFSLSSHRYSYISLLFSFRFIESYL